MPNADPRLCFLCGAQRELCSCERVTARHCLACHLLKHGVDTLTSEGTPSTGAPSKVDQCRDCPKEVEWYASDGTGFCEGHGKVPVA